MNTRIAMLTLVLVIVVSSIALAADEASTGVVNINTAEEEQLQLLPRIGPALASRIIEFREANGDFATIDELVAVKGIGESSIENLQPYLTTNGATTLTAKVKLPRSTASGSKAAG